MIDATTAGDVYDIPRGWVDGRGSLYCVEHGEDRPGATPEYGHGVDSDAACEYPGCGVVLYESPEWRKQIERVALDRTNAGKVRY
jgi:hypothetical protein